MFIKSIVLDGFKSYGQRTEVTGFDPLFTAITGLNGSGKSNVLDAICFILGISNLSHVRASNLQDLIYRSGQAGINKATVSVTFDNRNRTQSPPGFEDYEELTITRQVVIGGKNKYLINGSNVTNKKVQDLFCSIQLNVNNPHFLIMQGKVTKVLSMKPLEILGMIEEAAGTRVYEGKRQLAQRTITQKDEKLNEVTEVFSAELLPKLNKLREERAQFLEFQRIGRELQHMMNLYRAWQFVEAQKYAIEAQTALEKGQSEVDQFKEHISNNKSSIKRIESEMEEAVKNSRNEDNEKIKEIEMELKREEAKVAKANASLKSTLDEIATEERNKKQLEKDIKSDGISVKAKEDELAHTQEQFKELKEAYEHDNQQFMLAQRRFEALNAGKEVDDEGEVKTLQEQFIEAKQQASQANTENKQAAMQLNHCRTQLEMKQNELGKNSTEYEENKANLEIKQNEVMRLECELKKYNYSKEKLDELVEHKKLHSRDIHNLREKIDNFQSRIGRTEFRYKDPYANFNRNSVKGVICKLLKVRDRNFCAALEAAAGGRLYNVVVDTEVTSKQLLERGEFQFRTTFIPLNKIRSQRMSDDMVRLAKDLVGKDNVHSALSLIEYDRSLQPAMEFIFGNIFICKDMNVAKKVSFHNRILKKCVTLDGDVCDPSGILSGGATVKSEPILSQLAAVVQCEEQLRVKTQEFHQIETQIRNMNEIQHKFSAPLDVKKYEVDMLRQRLQQTTYHIQKEEVNNLKLQIEQLQEKMKTCKEIETKFNTKLTELELKMSNKGNRDSLLKQAETNMKKLKEKSDKSQTEWNKHEQNYETLILEISELKNGLTEQANEIQTINETINKLKEMCEEKKRNLDELNKIVENIQNDLNKEMLEISAKNKVIQEKLAIKEQLLTEIDEFELEIKRRSHEIKKLQESCKLSKSKELDYGKNMNKDDRYLKEAEELDQTAGQDLERRIRNAQEKKTKLGRTVNAKAHSMIEQEEKSFNDLVKKKNVVVDDKKNILTVMADLDEKKKNTLKLAYEQISKDFGSIFSTLLPGSDAKLVPLFGKTILDGLEVKVFLGGVWKNNLTELSGGQRSLAALSLILAMLLFNPAPLYILDEIDAALDLSHTQNIGQMLKTHFKQSQFIVVSLKDGMFSNANVLFRTKFVDGVSTITRTVNRNA